jgi:hypothetical protein
MPLNGNKKPHSGFVAGAGSSMVQLGVAIVRNRMRFQPCWFLTQDANAPTI